MSSCVLPFAPTGFETGTSMGADPRRGSCEISWVRSASSNQVPSRQPRMPYCVCFLMMKKLNQNQISVSENFLRLRSRTLDEGGGSLLHVSTLCFMSLPPLRLSLHRPAPWSSVPTPNQDRRQTTQWISAGVAYSSKLQSNILVYISRISK